MDGAAHTPRGAANANCPGKRTMTENAAPGRAMVLANFNTDMGDGWEWSNAEEYPRYIQYTAQSYRMFINEVVYALTH